ncbi:MAG: hypothetical protein ACFWTW_08930 [Lentilactobacillus parabuchneri]|jgi:hypothetical protein
MIDLFYYNEKGLSQPHISVRMTQSFFRLTNNELVQPNNVTNLIFRIN